MAPIVHGLEAQYAGQIRFTYLDIDDPNTQSFKQELGYIYQPHIFVLDGQGQILNQWVGPVEAAEIDNALQSALDG